MGTEFTHTSAIIHSIYEGEPLKNMLEFDGIKVVYFSESIPENLLETLEKHKAEGAIMHNVALADEKTIQNAVANGKKIAVIMTLQMTSAHIDMYNRLELEGCLITPRFTSNERLIKKYINLLESQS